MNSGVVVVAVHKREHLVIDALDRVHLAYFPGGGILMSYAIKEPVTGQWSRGVFPMGSNNIPTPDMPDLAIDSDNKAHVAFVAGRVYYGPITCN